MQRRRARASRCRPDRGPTGRHRCDRGHGRDRCDRRNGRHWGHRRDGRDRPARRRGPRWPTGLQGPAGLTGPAGPAGADGATGPQGAAGPVGPTGATGESGAPGPAGPMGATGATGETGLMGAAGKNGKVRLVTCTRTPTKKRTPKGTPIYKTTCTTHLLKGAASFSTGSATPTDSGATTTTAPATKSGVAVGHGGQRLKVSVLEQDDGALLVQRPSGARDPARRLRARAPRRNAPHHHQLSGHQRGHRGALIAGGTPAVGNGRPRAVPRSCG